MAMTARQRHVHTHGDCDSDGNGLSAAAMGVRVMGAAMGAAIARWRDQWGPWQKRASTVFNCRRRGAGGLQNRQRQQWGRTWDSNGDGGSDGGVDPRAAAPPPPPPPPPSISLSSVPGVNKLTDEKIAREINKIAKEIKQSLRTYDNGGDKNSPFTFRRAAVSGAVIDKVRAYVERAASVNETKIAKATAGAALKAEGKKSNQMYSASINTK